MYYEVKIKYPEVNEVGGTGQGEGFQGSHHQSHHLFPDQQGDKRGGGR